MGALPTNSCVILPKVCAIGLPTGATAGKVVLEEEVAAAAELTEPGARERGSEVVVSCNCRLRVSPSVELFHIRGPPSEPAVDIAGLNSDVMVTNTDIPRKVG